MSACRTKEERRFYMELAVRKRCSVRGLERQVDSVYYTLCHFYAAIFFFCVIDTP